MTRRHVVEEGQRFGMLVITNPDAKRVWRTSYRPKGTPAAEVRCDCGATRIVPILRLVSGRTSSCGCAKRARVLAINALRWRIPRAEVFERDTRPRWMARVVIGVYDTRQEAQEAADQALKELLAGGIAREEEHGNDGSRVGSRV